MSTKFLAYGLIALIQLMGVFAGSVMTVMYFNLGQYSPILFASFFTMFLGGFAVVTIELGKLLVELKQDQNELKQLKKVDDEEDVHPNPVRRSRSTIS